VSTDELPLFERLPTEVTAVEVFEEGLGPDELIREALMLGLRTREGMDLDATAARAGRDPRLGREQALARQASRGHLVDGGDRWHVPQASWLALDGIVADLF